MKKGLSVSNLKKLIVKAEGSFRHEECATCECFLGYVAQLEIDSDPEGQGYLNDYQPSLNQIHACLGYDPCAPGILYTNYLRVKRLSGTQQLAAGLISNQSTGSTMNYVSLSFALLPILLILVLLVWKRTPADIAGLIGWICTLLVAWLYFKTPLINTLLISFSGVVASLPITIMVATSLFQITLIKESGAIDRVVAFIKTVAPGN